MKPRVRQAADRSREMDECEALAEAFLRAEGYDDFVFEPDGNVPPDFLINAEIAVEVRRLNKNHDDGDGARGLEEVSISLGKRFEAHLPSFGAPRTGESWYVRYRFRRPISRWKELRPKVDGALEAFLVSTAKGERHTIPIEAGFELAISRSMPRDELFTFGGCIDFDEGGWVVPIVSENLVHCIADKSAKIAPFRAKYPRWWLIMPDYMGCAVGVLRDKEERPLRVDRGPFERVIVIDPYNPTRSAQV